MEPLTSNDFFSSNSSQITGKRSIPQDKRDSLFPVMPGAEVRLVAKEIMSWTGQDLDAEVVRIELGESYSDITRSWIAESEA